MSLLKVYYLICNGCRRVHGKGERGYGANQTARAKARCDGWRRVPGGVIDGLDICPSCLPRYPEAR